MVEYSVMVLIFDLSGQVLIRTRMLIKQMQNNNNYYYYYYYSK